MEEVPHDTSSFTQGLTHFDGHIYEGTGLEQQSSLLRHDPSDGMKTLDKLPLSKSALSDDHLFGEGITHYHVWKMDESTGRRAKEHRLIQLTWKNKVAKVYSLPSMEVLREFAYATTTGEGWGITFVPRTDEFYVSDGSDRLMVWDAETFVEKRRLSVTFEPSGGEAQSVRHVNELEFVDYAAANGIDDSDGRRTCGGDDDGGEGTCPPATFTSSMKILANLWYQDVIVAIDPMTGKISRVYDLRDIYPHHTREEGADCLNGISLSGAVKRDGEEGLEIWVTGKLWPKMYRIRLIENGEV